MNQNICKLLDVIETLREIQGCELEVQSLSHKVKALYSQGKEGLTGVAFIDACDDDELRAAIVQKDPRTSLHPFVDPSVFSYLKRNRPWAVFIKS
jgi:hypothetical protein